MSKLDETLAKRWKLEQERQLLEAKMAAIYGPDFTYHDMTIEHDNERTRMIDLDDAIKELTKTLY